MKHQKHSGELRRTVEKIEHCIINPAPDGTDRMRSAMSTQAQIAFDLEALEMQPSRAGQHRKGYKAPFRIAIEKICGRLDKPDLESVLNVLEDEDDINDMYESLNDRIDIHTVEVFRDRDEMKFSLRNGSEKTATFKTVRNLISKYKSSLPD